MRYILIFILFLLAECYNGLGQSLDSLNRYEYSHNQMGTIFNIICYADNEIEVNKVVERAFLLIDSLNMIFSDFNPESELNKLCMQSGSGEYVSVSPMLFDVIRQSIQWSKKSCGIFDITVGPYTQLWRRAIRQGEMPDSIRMMKASESVGYRNVKLKPGIHGVRLIKKDMQLDLGGIAKGYTVDKVYEFLVDNGIKICLVDGGGDLYAGEKPVDKDGWKVSFPDIEEKNFITITNRAVATSGDLYRFFEHNGKRYSHIVDPRTGMGITTRRTVSVWAPNATDADALATILSIDGPVTGFRLLKKLKGVSALIVENNGSEIKKYESGEINFIK